MSCSVSVARAIAVPGLLLLLILATALSLAIGAKSLPASVVLEAITGTCQSADCTIVLDARLAAHAGLACWLAAHWGSPGRLMQTLTRNPLADPGILGVNSRRQFRDRTRRGAVWFFLSTGTVADGVCRGAGRLADCRLYRQPRRRAVKPGSPHAGGVALGAVLEGLSNGIALLNPDVYDQLRFWQAGSLDIRSLQTLKVIVVPVLIAGATALFLSRALNSLSLGSDTATALGSKVARTQLIGLLVITVLCGSATAVVGPIAFIGLMMPHMARWLVGPDHRWSLPVTLLATPTLLLFADIIGRLIVPGELRVSVVSAFLGAPVLIFLVRRKQRGGAV
ncbi:iron-enterobactin transporter membrane protein [Citrobacter koseri]|nr:iron-enterobactin transporter membrane protein [Citrobacter koseri]